MKRFPTEISNERKIKLISNSLLDSVVRFCFKIKTRKTISDNKSKKLKALDFKIHLLTPRAD